jgi:hypothetical protein
VSGGPVTNRRRAAAAAELLAMYTVTPGSVSVPDRAAVPADMPGQVTQVLAAIRHYATGRFSVAEALAAATGEGRRTVPLPVSRARWQVMARRGAVMLHRFSDALAGTGYWAGTAEAMITDMAVRRRSTLDATAFALATAVITDLGCCAGAKGVRFSETAARSLDAYLAQRVAEEPAFRAGTTTRHASVLPPLPAGRPWRPVPTDVGVVTSDADAQWLVVRTEALARCYGITQLPYTEDLDRLYGALAAARSLNFTRPLRIRLEPAIAARVWELENGPAAAAALGREHGLAGTPPHASLLPAAGRRALDGSRPLLLALGETERTCDLNEIHRRQLVDAYGSAYEQARSQAGAAPLQAARDFPRNPRQFLGAVPPADRIRSAASRPHPAAAPRPLARP